MAVVSKSSPLAAAASLDPTAKDTIRSQPSSGWAALNLREAWQYQVAYSAAFALAAFVGGALAFQMMGCRFADVI